VTESRRHDAIAIAILGLLASLLFYDVLIGTHNFYLRDLTRYYYPVKQVLRDIVMSGEFPYWNRQFGGGQPIAANPEHEVFYPLTWLILLPDYFLGYRLHILVHIYIGLFGMYALLRSMALRAPAAFFGALSFGLGGVYLSYVNLLPILFCAAWLPLTCLFVRRFLLAPRLRDFALAALFLGLQFIVGEPTTVMQTGFLLGMYALYRGWYAARDHDLPWTYAIPEMFTRVVFIGLISICGFLVGAAQMISAIDHVGDSARSRVFDFSLVSAWSMPWAKFAEFIYPNLLGHMSVDRITWYWGGGLYPGMGSPFIFSVYPGLLMTTLVAAAIFVRPRGGRFVLIVSVFSFLIALGGHTPLLRALYEAGVATSIRYPEKFVLIASFAMILLASQMLDRLLDGDRATREAALGFVAAVTVVAGLIALSGLTPYYDRAFSWIWGLKQSSSGRILDLSYQTWIIALVRGLVLFAVLWFAPKVRRPLWIALLAVFMVSDLAPLAEEVNPRMPAEFFTTTPPALRALPKDRTPFRIFHEADWYGQEAVAKKYFSTGAAVYWIVRNGIFPMTPVAYDLNMVIERDYDKTALLPTLDFIDSTWAMKRSGRRDWWVPMMAMSNAWYRGVYKPFDQEQKRVGGKMEKADPIQFVEADHQPRYYFADQLLTIDNRHDFVRHLSKGSFSSNVAFVMGPAFVPARGVVHSWRETANTATLDVESVGGRGFLVMSVTPHKYWRITVDGKRVDAIVTNIGFQGIPVPAGRHRVEMHYRNPLAAGGAKISIVSAVLLIIAAVIPRRRLLA